MVLVLGRNGQIARSLKELKDQYIYVSSQEAPFTQPQKVLQILDEHKPKVVVNAAAYTAVDKAESERDLALQVNAHILKDIAGWCFKNKSILIHYSTDYVFDGSGETPWVETDIPAPINWYGHTKHQGEQRILESGCDHYIFRVSWVHSPWGHNFKNTILKLAQEKEELRIVCDQWGAPTDARDIAQTTVDLVDKVIEKNNTTLPHGLYHLRYSDYTNWYNFAVTIIVEAREAGLAIKTKKIHPISSEEYMTAAKRPKNSRLGTIYGTQLVPDKNEPF